MGHIVSGRKSLSSTSLLLGSLAGGSGGGRLPSIEECLKALKVMMSTVVWVCVVEATVWRTAVWSQSSR